MKNTYYLWINKITKLVTLVHVLHTACIRLILDRVVHSIAIGYIDILVRQASYLIKVKNKMYINLKEVGIAIKVRKQVVTSNQSQELHTYVLACIGYC